MTDFSGLIMAVKASEVQGTEGLDFSQLRMSDRLELSERQAVRHLYRR